PWYVGVTLFQPVVWLLLFGALFKNVVQIPGFEGTSYKDFLAPGVVIMSAVFSAGWNGMGTIEDLDRGVMDRFLVAPVSRAPLILAVTLLSGGVMQLSRAPGWSPTVGDCNPRNWAVAAGREAVSANADWAFVMSRVGLLAALAIACVLLATRAFRSYQRSA